MAENTHECECIKNLVSAKTAATIKKFANTDAFMHHVRNKAGTPQPVIIDGRQFWNRSEIEQWEPNKKRGPITTEGDEANG